MKKSTIIIITISIFIASFIGIFAMIRFVNPSTIKVNYIDIVDEQINDNFNDVSISFFSDVEYGTFFDRNRLENMINVFSTINSDIVIFGGDLFDEKYIPSEVTKELMINSLKKINAPLGKFAIIGDFDSYSTEKKKDIQDILFASDFELLNNNNIKIHNKTNDFINLVGIDYTTNTDNISDYYSAIDASKFTISVIHGASISDYIPINYSNLTLSGHSHHCQVMLFKPYKEYPQTANYTIGLQNSVNTKLYVTSGIGTTNNDIRVFSNSEIMVFRLKKDN